MRDRAVREGLRTKQRSRTDRPGGQPFTAGHLRQLLQNPVYVGKVRHRGFVYEGEHEPIVDQSVFDAVGETLRQRASPRASTRTTGPHRLKGLAYDETGDQLTPTYAIRSGRRYHYYVSHRLLKVRAADAGDGWRLPAGALETAVIDELVALLRQPTKLPDILAIWLDAKEVEQIVSRATAIANELQAAETDTGQTHISAMVERIEVAENALSLKLSRDGLLRCLTGTRADHHLSSCHNPTDPIVIDVPWSVRRRGIEKRLVLNGAPRGDPDPSLLALLRRAHQAIALLADGTAGSIEVAAKSLGLDRGEVSRVLQLAFLAPDITKAILDGRQPADLTARTLSRVGTLPADWTAQRRLLGFPSN